MGGIISVCGGERSVVATIMVVDYVAVGGWIPIPVKPDELLERIARFSK